MSGTHVLYGARVANCDVDPENPRRMGRAVRGGNFKTALGEAVPGWLVQIQRKGLPCTA